MEIHSACSLASYFRHYISETSQSQARLRAGRISRGGLFEFFFAESVCVHSITIKFDFLLKWSPNLKQRTLSSTSANGTLNFLVSLGAVRFKTVQNIYSVSVQIFNSILPPATYQPTEADS